MKTRLFILLSLLVVVVFGTVTPLTAQEIPQPDLSTPESAVLEYYAFLLSATSESFDFLPIYVCAEYFFQRQVFEEIVAARQDATADFSNLTITVDEVADDNLSGTVKISGEPALSNGGAVDMPDSIYMVNDGNWRVCPSDSHIRVIRPEDLALTEADADAAALQFYNAFYINDQERVAAYTCVEKQEVNLLGTAENFFGFQVMPSEWSYTLTPDGYDLVVDTVGNLQLSIDGRPAAVKDWLDFTDARMVRENGWKFCDGYREEERFIVDYILAYYSDTPAEDIARLSCPQYRNLLAEASQQWNLQISDRNVPEGIFNSTQPGTGEANNLQGLILTTDRGLVSIGAEFGPRAQVMKVANQWKWCQPPLSAGIEATEETTEESAP